MCVSLTKNNTSHQENFEGILACNFETLQWIMNCFFFLNSWIIYLKEIYKLVDNPHLNYIIRNHL